MTKYVEAQRVAGTVHLEPSHKVTDGTSHSVEVALFLLTLVVFLVLLRRRSH